MQRLHAMQAASISELKKNPTKLINEADGEPVVILNHNTASAYLIPAQTFEHMLDLLDDFELMKLAKARLKDGKRSNKVDLDGL